MRLPAGISGSQSSQGHIDRRRETKWFFPRRWRRKVSGGTPCLFAQRSHTAPPAVLTCHQSRTRRTAWRVLNHPDVRVITTAALGARG
jgi:hypothetical protein